MEAISTNNLPHRKPRMIKRYQQSLAVVKFLCLKMFQSCDLLKWPAIPRTKLYGKQCQISLDLGPLL